MSAENVHGQAAAAGFLLGPVMVVIAIFYAIGYAFLAGFLLCVLIPVIMFPLSGAILWIGGHTGLFEAIPYALSKGSWAPFAGVGLIVLTIGIVAALAAVEILLCNASRIMRIARWLARCAYLQGILFFIFFYSSGYNDTMPEIRQIHFEWLRRLGKHFADLDFDIYPFVNKLVGIGISGVHIPYKLMMGQLPSRWVAEWPNHPTYATPALYAFGIVLLLNILLYWFWRAHVWGGSWGLPFNIADWLRSRRTKNKQSSRGQRTRTQPSRPRPRSPQAPRR